MPEHHISKLQYSLTSAPDFACSVNLFVHTVPQESQYSQMVIKFYFENKILILTILDTIESTLFSLKWLYTEKKDIRYQCKQNLDEKKKFKS